MLRLRTAATHPLSCSTGAKTSGARGLGPTFVHIRRAVLCNAIRVRFPLYGCSCCHAWLGGRGFCGWFDPEEKGGPLSIADRQKTDEASKPTNGLSLRCDPHGNLPQALRVWSLPGRVFTSYLSFNFNPAVARGFSCSLTDIRSRPSSAYHGVVIPEDQRGAVAAR